MIVIRFYFIAFEKFLLPKRKLTSDDLRCALAVVFLAKNRGSRLATPFVRIGQTQKTREYCNEDPRSS